MEEDNVRMRELHLKKNYVEHKFAKHEGSSIFIVYSSDCQQWTPCVPLVKASFFATEQQMRNMPKYSTDELELYYKNLGKPRTK